MSLEGVTGTELQRLTELAAPAARAPEDAAQPVERGWPRRAAAWVAERYRFRFIRTYTADN